MCYMSVCQLSCQSKPQEPKNVHFSSSHVCPAKVFFKRSNNQLISKHTVKAHSSIFTHKLVSLCIYITIYMYCLTFQSSQLASDMCQVACTGVNTTPHLTQAAKWSSIASLHSLHLVPNAEAVGMKWYSLSKCSVFSFPHLPQPLIITALQIQIDFIKIH